MSVKIPPYFLLVIWNKKNDQVILSANNREDLGEKYREYLIRNISEKECEEGKEKNKQKNDAELIDTFVRGISEYNIYTDPKLDCAYKIALYFLADE
jgi:hypothetical protein